MVVVFLIIQLDVVQLYLLKDCVQKVSLIFNFGSLGNEGVFSSSCISQDYFRTEEIDLANIFAFENTWAVIKRLY